MKSKTRVGFRHVRGRPQPPDETPGRPVRFDPFPEEGRPRSVWSRLSAPAGPQKPRPHSLPAPIALAKGDGNPTSHPTWKRGGYGWSLDEPPHPTPSRLCERIPPIPDPVSRKDAKPPRCFHPLNPAILFTILPAVPAPRAPVASRCGRPKSAITIGTALSSDQARCPAKWNGLHAIAQLVSFPVVYQQGPTGAFRPRPELS
jgi:hypothetical protein